MRFQEYFNDETMLYGGRYSPVLDYLGFVRMPARQAAQLLDARYRQAKNFFKNELVGLEGQLEHNLLLLEPFSGGIISQFLVTQTADPQWSMIIDNYVLGGGGNSAVFYLAKISKCEGLALDLTRASENPETGYGKLASCRFDYYPPNVAFGNSALCHVSVSDQGNHRVVWHFEHSKEYFDFEDVEGYKARLKTDRFNPLKALQYCKHFGLDPFNEDFYTNEAYLIKTCYKTKNKPLFELTLPQLRERFGYNLLDTPPA